MEDDVFCSAVLFELEEEGAVVGDEFEVAVDFGVGLLHL